MLDEEVTCSLAIHVQFHAVYFAQSIFPSFVFFQHGAMEAVVPLKWISKHRNSLIKDKVYRLRYLQINDARNSYRPVPHPFMARLTGHTQIVEVTQVPQSFPLYACSIASFTTLQTRSDDRNDMSERLLYFLFGVLTRPSFKLSQSRSYSWAPMSRPSFCSLVLL